MITLSVDGSRVIAKFERIQADARQSLIRAVNIAVLELEAYIKTSKLRGGTPLYSRTGNLSRAVHSVLATDSGGTIVGRVGVDSTAPYARFQEYGIAHSWTIDPHDRKALHFEVGGGWVFAKRVTHPGLKERSFMRSALEEKRADILERLRATVREQTRGN